MDLRLVLFIPLLWFNYSQTFEVACLCTLYYLCDDIVGTEEEPDRDIRNATLPCESFLEVCCRVPNQENATAVPPSYSKNPKVCGKHTYGIGFDTDSEPKLGEFPWIVAILRTGSATPTQENAIEFHCVGSLIHSQAVLTSAYCVSANRRLENKQLIIRVGEMDYQHEVELLPHEDREVKSIIVHSEYNNQTRLNDAAIIILDSPVQISDIVDVTCLPSQHDTIDTSKCSVISWIDNSILSKMDLSLIPLDTCQNKMRLTRLGQRFELDESFICAEGRLGDNICKIPHGSPLVCQIPGEETYVQAGIISWSISCGENHIPVISANVTKFSKWIDELMEANNLNSSVYKYENN